MSSITLGVAALVAINSFRTNALKSVERESRALLGADLRFWSNRPFPDSVALLIDSASAVHDVARVTTLVSMGVAANTGATRLLQMRAVEAGYPYYGAVETTPAGQWQELQRGGRAVVDEGVLTALDMSVGDTLLLGEAAFVISASMKKSPADLSFRNIIGPRVYIGAADLPKTALLQFGSLAQYQVYFRIPNAKTLEQFVDRRNRLLRRHQIGIETAEAQSENLAEALSALSRFLGLVGLAALLLGGIGVATAVHVFVKDKRPIIAMLRCLGARERTVFGAYLLQAAALSTLGALLGVVLGFGVQAVLPRVMSGVVPFQVSFGVDWVSAAAGLGVGVLVAVLFAIVPLLTIRGVSPLQALRVDYEPIARRVDWYRVLSLVALIVGITVLSIWQADRMDAGLAFAGALAATLFILWLVAWLLTRIARRLPRAARFTVRQGIANLYRPHNQTVSVTLSLGFGVFVITTMLAVQTNLLGWLDIESQEQAPNVVAFDIQADQAESARGIMTRHKAAAVSFTPIVPARITAINGVTADSLLARRRERKVEPWALRREYRNTYRDTMVASEKLVAGKWFDKAQRISGATPISIEQDVARDLGARLGDRLTWDFQGVVVESQITSIREVDWARFNTNFFVVFPSGVLENTPQTHVALARVDDPAARAAVQRDLVAAHSNVSVIDLATVRQALDDILSKVTMAIRFMALFSIVAGIIVLVGAIATSRFQRLREGALLKTLGASRAQITQVLVTEYAALGMLAAATGVLLGGVGSWLLVKYFFRLKYELPMVALLILWVGVMVLAVTIGLANSRDVFRRQPLAVLREISE